MSPWITLHADGRVTLVSTALEWARGRVQAQILADELVPGVAPALANAIFAATHRRLRSLPLNLA
jgi:hypothetical protein